jgi:hypothetical protein
MALGEEEGLFDFLPEQAAPERVGGGLPRLPIRRSGGAALWQAAAHSMAATYARFIAIQRQNTPRRHIQLAARSIKRSTKVDSFPGSHLSTKPGQVQTIINGLRSGQ